MCRLRYVHPATTSVNLSTCPVTSLIAKEAEGTTVFKKKNIPGVVPHVLMWDSAIRRLREGVTVGGLVLLAGERSPGRFPEETQHEVFLKAGGREGRVLSMRLYRGWHEYRPWVEFSKIRNKLHLKDGLFEYLNTDIEKYLLKSFSDPLPAGGKIYVGYGSDIETGLGLLEVSPAASYKTGIQALQTWVHMVQGLVFP